MTSLIRLITHNFPPWLSTFGSSLLGQECYTTIVYNVDLTHTACLRLALSKGLGLGIVVFGSLLKLPQMAKIVSKKSTKGISLAMYGMECWAFVVSLVYAYRQQLPFSTYGENASLTVQNFIITLLIIYYAPSPRRLPPHQSRRPSRTLPLILTSLLMLSTTLFLLSPTLCPPSLLSLLQATTIPVSLVSKLPQMAQLHRDKAVGNLSALVVFAQLAGTVARVFTTMTETDDMLLLAGFAGATLFNAIIATQYIMYWNGDDKNAVLGAGASAAGRYDEKAAAPYGAKRD